MQALVPADAGGTAFPTGADEVLVFEIVSLAAVARAEVEGSPVERTARPLMHSRLITHRRLADLQPKTGVIHFQKSAFPQDADDARFHLVTRRAPRRVQPARYRGKLQRNVGLVLDIGG